MLTSQTKAHSYILAGLVACLLTLAGCGGGSSSPSNTPPIAHAGSDQSVSKHDTVTLDGSGSSDPNNDPLTYIWTQVSGSLVSLNNNTLAQPTFTAPDVFSTLTFWLVVNDGELSSVTDTVVITVANNTPIANAGSDQHSIAKRTLVTLDGTASSDSDGDSFTYLWIQTSGIPISLSNNTHAQPTFITPGISGVLTFSLVVNDGEVDSIADTVTVTVVNNIPIAHAGSDQPAIAKRSLVTLDGTASSDPNGDPLNYNWSQTGGTTVSLSDNTAAQPTFTTPGLSDTLTFSLVVNDGEVDSAVDTVVITVVNNTPSANAGPDQTVKPGITVQLDGTSSSDPDGDSLTYAWAQSSGTTITLSDAASVKPTFTSAGTFETMIFDLVVNDGETNSITDTVTVTVFNTSPTANAGPDANYNGGETAMLDGSASSDADGDKLRYRWIQIGGTNQVLLSDPSAKQPLFAVPNANDILTFSLVTNDGAVDSVADTVSITTLSYSGVGVTLSGHPFRAYLDTENSVSHAIVVGNYAYVANSSTGLLIVDVSDPISSGIVGTYDTPGSSRDVDVVGNYAYVADNTAGLQIIDISNKANPVYVGSYDTPGNANGMAVIGNYAFVADGSSLQIIDVSNPAVPVLAGAFDTAGYAEQVAVAGNFAYVTGQYNGLQVIDISDPVAPIFETAYIYNSLAPLRDITIAGNYAYLAYGAFGIVVVDVSDPANPAFLSRLDYSPYAVYGSDVAVVGNYAYVADYYAGLYIIDVSDLANPVVVAHYDTPGNGLGITMAGNHAYVADGLSGLSIIDVRVNAFLSPPATYDTPGIAWDIDLVGDHAYMADGSSGMQIIDVVNPLSPTQVGSYNTPNNNALGVSISDDYAFMAGDFIGLHIIDISNPVAPIFSSSYDTSGRASNVAVLGSYAYVADQTAGLQIIDVTDPATPSFTSNYATTYAYNVEVAGNHAYVADGSAGLQIIDVTDPASPSFTSNYPSTMALGATVIGNYTYLADDTSGLKILDVSMPSSPSLIGSYDTPGHAFDVKVGGNYAYVADDGFGLQIVDITDPANPFLAGSHEPLSQMNGVALGGEYLFIADDGRGLTVAERLPLLNAYYTEEIITSVLSYEISWERSEDTIVDCQVTGGACVVTSVNQSLNIATVEWTLPALAGDHEIIFVTGNPHFFVTTKDRVSVQ